LVDIVVADKNLHCAFPLDQIDGWARWPELFKPLAYGSHNLAVGRELVGMRADWLVGSVGIFAQHELERRFTRSTGFRHGVEINLGVIDRAGSSGAIDLPAP
jgi:hypothetical protein